jgi:tRNA-dihydrouridine synthase
MITVHGRTRCQFYRGQANWAAIRAVKDSIAIPLAVNGDIRDYDDADKALHQSGADMVMVGRAAQGRPWFPGQLARYLATGKRENDPDLLTQLALVSEVYEEMVLHHGTEIGRRHARKHIASALDVAAQNAGASGEALKARRFAVLTAETPSQTLAALAETFEAFAAAKGERGQAA